MSEIIYLHILIRSHKKKYYNNATKKEVHWCLYRRAALSEASRKTSAARPAAGGASSDSLRAFRAVCERALLDQQVLAPHQHLLTCRCLKNRVDHLKTNFVLF